MVVCTYKAYANVEDKKFTEVGSNKFKIYSTAAVYKIVHKWNTQGILNTCAPILWFYEIYSVATATTEEENDCHIISFDETGEILKSKIS